MIELKILQGLPASGKSIFARKWVNEAPKERVIVNRDNIRRMLGPYWVPSREDLVTDIEENMILSSLSGGYNVVVDATNLRGIERFQNMIGVYSHLKHIPITVKTFNVPVEECIKRDKARPKEEQVGEQVIRNFAKKYSL